MKEVPKEKGLNREEILRDRERERYTGKDSLGLKVERKIERKKR